MSLRPGMPSTRALAAAALVVMAACGGGSGAPEIVVRDSAGVRVVEVGGLPERALPWAVATAPRVRIGGGATDERAQLYQVAGAAVRTDGRIVVGNAGTSEVRLFEADGTPAGSFGRSGGGPGEFGSVSLVGLLPGDSALVHDARHGRLTVVTPEMTLGRTVPTTSNGQPARASPHGLLRGGLMVASGSSRFDGAPATGVLDPPAPLYVVGVDGAVADSAGAFPRRPMYLELGEGSMRLTRIPFGTETGVAVGPDRFHVGTADAYEIRTFDRRGRLTRVLRVDQPRRPVTDDDLAAHLARALERAPESGHAALRRAYEAMPVPDRMPAHGRLVADAAGNLWVEEYRAPGDAGSTAASPGAALWTVFDPDGRPLGTVETPNGLYVLEVGEDYILGTGADELDRAWVGVWGLERGG